MLLEREAQLASLGEHHDDARGGAGSLVLVAGEAGSGKTSLVRAYLGSLEASTLVIEGACDPLTTPRPLGPLHDFAADPDAGLEGLVRGERPPIEMFEEVLDRLNSTIRPIVVVVEDIHWADDATLDFLRFIGRRVGDTKSVVVCTYRDDEVGADHPLRPVLGQLIPLQSTTRIAVPPLSEMAVKTLTKDSSVDPVRLHTITGGNAFFVTEVIAAGGDMPRTVQDAVLARVAALDAEARRAVEAVSIAPRSLEIDKTTSLAGAGLDSIDRAVGSGVLLEERLHLRFRHELARAAIEHSIPVGRRLQLNLGIIGLLEEDPERDVARLAHHAIQAEAEESIARYAPQAADDAIARGARREAVAFLRAALDHSSKLEADEIAGLRVRLGEQLRILDRPGESLAELRLAIEHMRRQGNVETLAYALGLLQATLWNLRRFTEVWEAGAEAERALRRLGPSEALAMTLYRIAHNHMLARHAEPARRYAEEAAVIAKEVGSVEASWLALMVTGTIDIVLGRAEEGIRTLGRAVSEAEDLQDTRFIIIGLSMLGSGGGEARRYGAALPALRRGIEQGLATDEDSTVAYNRSWLARIAFEMGRWDEAAEHVELVGATTLQKEGIAYLTAMSALGRVRVRRGDPGCVPILQEMVELGRHHELQHAWNAVCGLAEYHWLGGHPDRGLEDLELAFERALDTDSEWARGEIGYWMWKAGAIDRAPDGTAEPFRLQIAGRWEEAAQTWRHIGCPYEAGMALSEGDVDAKLRALEIFDSLGARPIGDRLRAELRQDGVTSIPRGPVRSTRENLAGLTARQMEVLNLIGNGLSNSEIAETLFITKKTVEHHVSAIYAKLGVDDRVAAVHELAKRHPRRNRGTELVI